MANGGSGTMSAQIDSAPANLTANSFTRAGYTFAGWYTNSSGTGGTAYANQVSYNFAADLTLYAQWTPNPLTITYDTQGGGSIANGSTTTGASIASSPGTPIQAGFVFQGWFAASSGGTAITFPYAHGRTADFTLFTQWAPDPTATTVPVATTAPAMSPPASTTTSPTVSVPPSEPTPTIEAPRRIRTGTTVTVVARGFLPGESVVMSVGESGKTRVVIADSSGEVRLTVRLTSIDDGSRTVARASAGNRKASQEIEIKDPPKALPNTGSSLLLDVLVGSLFLIAGLAIIARRRFAPYGK